MNGMTKSKAFLVCCIAVMLNSCTTLTTGIGTIFGVVDVGGGEYAAANRTHPWSHKNMQQLLSGAELEAEEFCSKQNKTAEIINRKYIGCGSGCADVGEVRFRCKAKQ
jgi:hypothetical protein